MSPFSIYFPQFYPTPTNDRVWGRGFTDWALLANANLHDRWSRRAPARGFYDGADPSVHLAQIAEMQSYGLGGLGLYHYWFYSHQELDAFERTLLAPTSPQFPWFLIWASEGWSKRWIGDPSNIISLPTEPAMAEIERHCDHLARCFAQPSYFRWRDRPLFVWYNLAHFRFPEAIVEAYRRGLSARGFDMACGHFVKVPHDTAHSRYMDVTYLFEPRLFFNMGRIDRTSGARRLFELGVRLFGEKAASRLLLMNDRLRSAGRCHSADAFQQYLKSDERQMLVSSIPGTVQEVFSPGWNNTPRYADRFTALMDLPAEQFGSMVSDGCAGDLPPLINAWNEWTEGAAIEPCAYLGTRYLDALGREKLQQPSSALRAHVVQTDLSNGRT